MIDPIKMRLSISFCVVIRNRTHHLKRTLAQNLKDNSSYKELEFVILDYGSEELAYEWLKVEFYNEIKAGKIKYFRYERSEKWDPSHSKNVAFKLCSGFIICNIWADYYTGLDFASYVNAKFLEDNNIVLTPIDFHKLNTDFKPANDILGLVCVKKEDFYRVKGFDERMTIHGFEDYDFVNRLEMINVRRVLISDYKNFSFIPHDNHSRGIFYNEDIKINIRPLDPHRTQIIIASEKKLNVGVLINNNLKYSNMPHSAFSLNNYNFDYELEEMDWNTCFYISDENLYYLFENEALSIPYNYKGKNMINLRFDGFLKLDNPDTRHNILMFSHFFATRKFLEENLSKRTPVVNDLFGEGLVKSYTQ